MKHGQFAKGFRSMNKLRAHPIIAARDYYYSNIIYAEELRVAGVIAHTSLVCGIASLSHVFVVRTMPPRPSCWLSRCVEVRLPTCLTFLIAEEANISQLTLSRSTQPPSSNASVIPQPKLSTPLSDTVRCKSSLQFPRSSGSTPRVDEHSA